MLVKWKYNSGVAKVSEVFWFNYSQMLSNLGRYQPFTIRMKKENGELIEYEKGEILLSEYEILDSRNNLKILRDKSIIFFELSFYNILDEGVRDV
jgi:hypothetical protein